MPRRHQVPALVDLALFSVGEFVTTFGKNIVQPICSISKKSPQLGLAKLQSMLELMKYLLSSNVPWNLYDRMSVATLTAIRNLIKETKGAYNDYALITTFVSEINVILSLTEVAVDANLKAIEFSVWPKIMRHVLYNKLHYMSGLEILDLGSASAGWRTSDIEKIIINGISNMPNLICFILCFDCTDNIITAVAQNCKRLGKLDVTASRSVTDRSIPALLKCENLREIKLYKTSITVTGYAELFLEHLYVENIGRCDELGSVLEYIHERNQNFQKSFHIKAFECRNFTMEHLFLSVDMCPCITSLCILRDDRIDDLTILASLIHLRELKLLSCEFYTHGVKTLLELKGPAIISLHLEHVGEIDINALMDISQSSPKIQNLTFYNCEFSEHLPTYTRNLKIAPFRLLERIKCVVECASTHLEFLLSHCINVKFIQLGSSTGIGDITMKRILLQNPMNKLEEMKILYSHDLSMDTVQLLMQNCDNLRRLSELESWQGITSVELDLFRKELKINNINLDTSPTLSFA